MTYLNWIVHRHRKTEKVFFSTRNVLCVYHGWHGTHRYDIQVLTAHAPTWVHWYTSPLQCFVPLGTRDHVVMVGRASTAPTTWPRWPKGTYHCSSEEYWCTYVDACVARTWISYQCVLSSVVHTSNISLVVKKLFQFSCGFEQFHKGRSFGFLVINICNHGEYYATPRILTR
jgi:hypothetical protein